MKPAELAAQETAYLYMLMRHTNSKATFDADERGLKGRLESTQTHTQSQSQHLRADRHVFVNYQWTASGQPFSSLYTEASQTMMVLL